MSLSLSLSLSPKTPYPDYAPFLFLNEVPPSCSWITVFLTYCIPIGITTCGITTYQRNYEECWIALTYPQVPGLSECQSGGGGIPDSLDKNKQTALQARLPPVDSFSCVSFLGFLQTNFENGRQDTEGLRGGGGGVKSIMCGFPRVNK